MDKEEDTTEELSSNQPNGSEINLVPDNISTGIAGQSQSKWLLAHQQPQLVFLTFSSCMCFSDLHGDGEYRLVIADIGMGFVSQNGDTLRQSSASRRRFHNCRLLVLRGTSIQIELTLPEPPVGVVSFRLQGAGDNGGEVLGVAAGNCIYVYRNLKPFYKFALPPAPVDNRESEVWQKVLEEKVNAKQLQQRLKELQTIIGQHSLSAVSQALLDLAENEEEEIQNFVLKLTRDAAGSSANIIRRASVITCVATMRKSGGEMDLSACLIVGTEQQQLLIIEPHAFTVLQCVQLPASPVFLQASGAFDVDFRLLISCRDAQVYALRRGWPTPKLAVQLNSQPVGLLKYSSNLVVGCMNRSLSAYSAKGACLWTVQLPAPVCALAPVYVQMLGVRLVAVAMRNCEIWFYSDKNLVDRLRTEQPIIAIKFGRFGREEHTLVLISQTGDVQIYILRRTAKFFNLDPVATGSSSSAGSEKEMSISSTARLNIPKKTKLFVDQTMHERENSVSIHRTYQEDLYRFRLTTARAYVKAISSSLNPISMNSDTPVKLSAQVHGLGPIFRLLLEVQNTSLDKGSVGLFLTFACDSRIYRVGRTFIELPYLNPGMAYTFATKVEMVSELNLTDTIRVHVAKRTDPVPVISAVINMPTSEPIA